MSEYLLSAFIRANWELLLGRPIYRSQLRSHHFKGPYHTRPSTHLHATTHILIHHSPWRELHITDKTHTLFVSSPKSYGSFSIHTSQPALRYCIISSRRKGPWNLRSPTSRIRTILSSWDAIFPRRVYGQWADPGADWCGSYHLITHIRISYNATEISGWECGWRYGLVPRPPRNGRVWFRD